MKKIFLGWRALAFQNYVDALTELGVAIERDEPDGCDALLLPGGADIHPRCYGQEIDGSVDINEERDEYEFALFRRFAAQKLPILGICRGEQLINIALGGTLHQHVEGHKSADGPDLIHGVRTDDPELRALYGEHFVVNSVHHQSVDRPGEGLRVIARADDGTVEALRHETLPILALQWHPERIRGALAPEGVSDGAAVLRAFLRTL